MTNPILLDDSIENAGIREIVRKEYAKKRNFSKECDSMKKKIIRLIAIVVLAVSWISIAYSDYADLAISFDKPRFCISPMTADDGGSGKYIGLGYSFTIDGHLDVDSGFEIDSYTYKIFGITIKQDEANPQKG